MRNEASYEQIRQMLAGYRATLPSVGVTRLELDLASELEIIMRACERLERRVRHHWGMIVPSIMRQSAATLDKMRTEAEHDPALRKWFDNAPNPGMSWTVMASEGMEAPAYFGPTEKDSYEEMMLDSQAWYNQAHRALTVAARLPGLTGLRCRPVTIVRNQLLEHPEGRGSGITTPSFGFRIPGGPVMKAARFDGQPQTHQDMGFFVNSEAFRFAMHQVLSAAIR